MPASKYELQSGHCCFEDVSQSSKISVLFMSAMRSCDSLLNSLISFVCLKSRRKDSFLFGVSRTSRSTFWLCLTMCILLFNNRKRYTKNFGWSQDVRDPVHVDLVDQFESSMLIQPAVLSESSVPLGRAHPVFSCIPLSHWKLQVVCCGGRNPLSWASFKNCTNILYSDMVSKYFCMEQSLVLSSRIEFPP